MTISWRIWSLGLGGGFLILATLAAFLFQDNITRFLLNPQTPYQTYTPPPAPDYNDGDAWVLRPIPDAPVEGAEIFYVHSTTYYASDEWNGPIGDPQAVNTLFRTVLPNEAGPFLAAGRIWAPHYRQATLFAAFTHKDDGKEARQTAYGDVKRAFEVFLARRETNAPIILVGYEQGGLHVIRLMQEYFEKTPLRRKLAAAYVIDQAMPQDMFTVSLRDVRPCASADAVRCAVTWVAYEARFEKEIWRAKNRSLVWNIFGRLWTTRGKPLACVNPLSWETSGAYAPSSLHLGAAPATGLALDDAPIAVREAVGARCVDGVLVVDRPKESYLRRKALFGAKWRAQNFNLFYVDLQENAKTRVAALKQAIANENLAPPLAPVIDVRESPIRPVPDVN